MKKHTLKSTRKYSHLSSAEREEIAISLEMGLKQCEITFKLLRSTSTISREINRNKSLTRNGQYRASVAQYKANNRKELSHKRKRIPQKDLRRFISKWLKEGYSPEIIAFMASELRAFDVKQFR